MKQSSLRSLSAEQIVRAVSTAAERWTSSDFAPRVRATRAIAERLEYSEPVVAHALGCLFSSITYSALRATICDELGSLAALDGFAPRAERPQAFARGLGRIAIIASDSTIGVAITPLVFALCAKSSVDVRDRSDHLVAEFARSLSEEHSEFASALRVHPWGEREDAAWQAALSAADAVVAFGGDAGMRAIRERCKAGARFIAFGHRTSLGYVPREALTDETSAAYWAGQAARDALLYDGEGCLSLHAIFVERGGAVSPQAFASIFARACDETSSEFPCARQADPRVAAYARRCNFRSVQGNGAVHLGGNGTHLIAFDPPLNEAPPLLPRTIGIYPVDTPEALLAYTREHALPIEGIGSTSAPRAELIAAFALSGTSRITQLGKLQNPPLAGNHGGQARVLPFVSLVYREDVSEP